MDPFIRYTTEGPIRLTVEQMHDGCEECVRILYAAHDLKPHAKLERNMQEAYFRSHYANKQIRPKFLVGAW